MSQYVLAHASHTDWQIAIEDCIKQTKEYSTTQNATLGFIYVTDPFAEHFKKIITELENAFPTTDWIGTIGLSICVTNIEYADQAAIALLLSDIDKSTYQLFKEQEHLKPGDSSEVQFAILHGDPRNPLLTEQLKTMSSTLEPSFFVGGLTSAKTYFYQYAGNAEEHSISEGGFSGVVFNNSNHVMTGLTQGCSPISETFNITDCDHHMLLSIDDRPALDVFKESIGEILARDINRAAGYIFAGLPIKGSDTGDYLVRNIVGFDPDNHFLAIADDLNVDSPILFCKRDSQTAIEDLKRMLDSLKNRLNDKQPKAALYISCLGRGQHMFGDVSNEIKYISDVFGDIPLIGFYANGEIAGEELYGFTGVLTLLF